MRLLLSAEANARNSVVLTSTSIYVRICSAIAAKSTLQCLSLAKGTSTMVPLYAVNNYMSKKYLYFNEWPEGGGLQLEKHSGNVRNQKCKVMRVRL